MFSVNTSSVFQSNKTDSLLIEVNLVTVLIIRTTFVIFLRVQFILGLNGLNIKNYFLQLDIQLYVL